MVRKIWKNRKGFTLVELLIVVAIIGVLATVGIPTFKRMMEKSKKSEAKVNLGNLFTTEAAFYSEYGGYGNNLVSMGYEVDGNLTEMIYHMGFNEAGGVAAWTCTAAALPAIGSSMGGSINLSLNTYYPGGGTTCNQFGRTTLAIDSAGAKGVAADPYGTFLASASGVIAGGVDRDTANGDVNNLDSWTIDETRTLRNTHDGVK
jgi:prepilin-type N-terminal cleavage/methylation domain-containing protein